MKVKAGYKQTEVGVIPEEWEVHDLATVSSQITDGDHLTPIRTREGYYLLSARNVREGRIDLTDVDYVGLDEFKRMRSRCAPEAGDLLISCSGHGLGRVASVPEGLRCVLVRSAALVKLSPNKANSLFVQYWLQGTDAQQQISVALSRAAQPNLFLGSIERLRVPLPPTVSEQQAIAAALSDVDALLSSLDQLIAKKRDLKQAAMQQLLTGQKRLTGFQQEWETQRLGEHSAIMTGKKNNQDKRNDGDYPFFVRSQTVERIDSFSFDGEAILVPGEGGIGSIFHYINGKFDYHQRVYKISDFSAEMCGKFVYYCMTQSFHKEATRNSVKATVDSLRLPTFLQFEFLAPAVEEQRAIVEVLSDMDTEIAALETRREKTRVLKQGMMQELLTGKTRLV